MIYESLKQFYDSKAWEQCRESYLAELVKKYGCEICETCIEHGTLTPGYILHHKIRLSLANVNDPEIALNHEHLKYLCLECHNRTLVKQEEITAEGLYFDTDGNLAKRS